MFRERWPRKITHRWTCVVNRSGDVTQPIRSVCCLKFCDSSQKHTDERRDWWQQLQKVNLEIRAVHQEPYYENQVICVCLTQI